MFYFELFVSLFLQSPIRETIVKNLTRNAMFYVRKISVPNVLTRFVDKNATNVKGLSASFG